MKKSFLPLGLVSTAAAIALVSCAARDIAGNRPISFGNRPALPLMVGAVNILQTYDPKANPADVSSRFVTPPHEAIREYAQTRLRGAQGADTLQFIIEDATVLTREIEQDSSTLKWAGLGREDEYTVTVRVKVQKEGAGGLQGEGAIIRFRRTLVMPQSVSLVEREARQIRFLEQLIRDLDDSLTLSLRDSLKVL